MDSLGNRLIEMAMLDLRRNEAAITALAQKLLTEKHENDRWADRIEQRLVALETKPSPSPIGGGLNLSSLLLHPRLWWGLVVAGLAAAQVPLDTAIKIASGMP